MTVKINNNEHNQKMKVIPKKRCKQMINIIQMNQVMKVILKNKNTLKYESDKKNDYNQT